MASLVGQMVKNLPAMWGTQVRSLGQEDPLENGTATVVFYTVLYPLQYSCLDSPGWRSLVGYSPQGRKESDTTEQLHFTSLHI